MNRALNETQPVISETERKLLELLVTGASSKSIAAQMGLKDGTTRVYLHSLYKRIGVNNKTSAVTWYLDRQRPVEQATATTLVASETFGDRAVNSGLAGALGMMEVFLGPYGRMWDMLMQLEGDVAQIRNRDEIRVRSRMLWSALLRGDFAGAAAFYDRDGIGKLFIESPSDAVVLAAALLLGGYTARANKALTSLKLRRGGSIGITADEKAALAAIGDVVNQTAVENALGGLHHLIQRSSRRPVFRHLLIVALFHIYKMRHETELARDTGNVLWLEAEGARHHLQTMGDATFPPNVRLPEPPNLSKADVTRYLANVTA